MEDAVWLIPALPLLGFLVNGIFGRRLREPLPGILACLVVFGSLLLSALTLFQPDFTVQGPEWIPLQTFSLRFTLHVDGLTRIMLLVVCGVGLLIHIYSIEYMHGDPGVARYFAYLNFFMFAMLVLVMAGNLPLLFVGWEGVGLASYLLIGFWFRESARAEAGKKAFLVNRVGDFGFLLGMAALASLLGTLEFEPMREEVRKGAVSSAALLLPCLLLFAGACGKSAQIPLHVWLPDAMAGPTPVSALIHAATMVTAGVYLVVRLDFLYRLAPDALATIAEIGTATALLAGLMAVSEWNLKRVLAYSTVSQLGLMFAAAGCGGNVAAIFHLVTHAFFKALLFLAAGAVIHTLGGEEDMRRMGGLRKKMPFVFACFVVGALAISGIFPLAGFFSKEAVLASAFHHSRLLGVALLAASAITPFYMFRLVALTFLRPAQAVREPLHAPGPAMAIPLALLLLLTGIGGFAFGPGIARELHAHSDHGMDWTLFASGTGFAVFGIGLVLAATGPFEAAVHRFLGFALGLLVTGAGIGRFLLGSAREMLEESPARQLLFATGIAAGFLGVFLLLDTAGRFRPFLERLVETLDAKRTWRRLCEEKFYFDQVYENLIVLPMRMIAFLLWLFVDRALVDQGLVHGPAEAIVASSYRARARRPGLVNASVVVFAAGAFALVGILVYEWWRGR